ncbi:amidase [Falsiruegeria mediterranea]|uniref:Acylamidase n=1 Tax=Falsiruegeria mediterranea M17 TaxID=1200281 RepID=A0A2R8CFC4_9RHOB|nr:amidase [Falsiruegeria mediterranea]SPJ31162.1 Acylamidase [Falsiruegeria mediterranea M17]
MTDITNLSSVDMAQQIRAGALTATQVLAAHRDRVEAVNGVVNAFVTLDWEAAQIRTAELDHMAAQGRFAGPLHGVPIAIKDVFETKSLRTTYGSKSFETHVPDADALHVKRLRDAGAVIFGKTNTPEFAFSGQTSNPVSGTTRNPHDPAKTVAGSSGGAAAALAAGMTPLADGSDLGGSTRTPAAWCGVVGYRPTSGLIPYDPNPTPFDGLSIPGPMARNVSDLTLMLEVMQGNTMAQPLGYWFEPPSLAKLNAPVEPRKLALSLAPFGASVDPSIQAAIAPVADLCRAVGWQIKEDAPDLAPLLPFGGLIRGLSALGYRDAIQPDMAQASPSFVRACAAGEGLNLQDYIDYRRVRTQVWQATARFFEAHDFALWPTTTGLAFSADQPDHDLPEDWRSVTLTPVMELPSISIPFGTSSDGMPVGLHITGPRGSDAKLLRFARWIERTVSGDIR